MNYMNLHSKPLERLGLQTNSTLMRFYVGFWGSLGLIAVTLIFCFIWQAYVVISLDSYFRVIITRACLQLAFTLILAGLDIVVLYAYLRFSDRLSERVARHLTNSLIRTDSSVEREQAQKRQTVYRELADR